MSGVSGFSERTALITGGAAGIGEAIVRRMAAEGAQILFCDVNAPAGEALADELRRSGLDVRFAACDVTDEAAVERLVATASEMSGRLDIAVNNVGGFGEGDTSDKRVHDTDLAVWSATMNLNLTSCFLGMKHQLRPMLSQGMGAIVNITSLAGMRWSPAACPSYAAAKAGVVRLTEYAAVAYAAFGIRVNVVAPGLTATKAVVNAFPDAAERAAMASASQPMNRMIEPAEIADAVLWACSDASSGVTGLTIPVDGGWAAK